MVNALIERQLSDIGERSLLYLFQCYKRLFLCSAKIDFFTYQARESLSNAWFWYKFLVTLFVRPMPGLITDFCHFP